MARHPLLIWGDPGHIFRSPYILAQGHSRVNGFFHTFGDMYAHATTFRVRYAHTDQMGYLYYGHYPMLYEIGRVEMLRALGMRYRDMEEELGVMMPVMSLEMRYVRPAQYDQLLTIETRLSELPAQTIVFKVEVRNEAGKLLNGGRVKLCFVDAESRKRVPAPTALIEKLAPHF